MSNFKPMLAATVTDLDDLRFPLLGSAKLDGVRAIVIDGIVMSRSLKVIPNKHVQKLFGTKENNGIDGELIIGPPNAKDVYRQTVSGVMRHDGEPDVKLYAFDTISNPDLPYGVRMPQRVRDNVINLNQMVISDVDELLAFEAHMLDLGYEGLILRHPEGKYKFGRSTLKEGLLIKLKRFVDAEAEVIGFEERMHNGNEATINELGRTKRSSHKAGKSGRGDLGALLVRFGDCEFSIGAGFSDDERSRIWNDRDKYLNKLAKFKYFPIGVKDAPRHPVFIGWRDEIDT